MDGNAGMRPGCGGMRLERTGLECDSLEGPMAVQIGMGKWHCWSWTLLCRGGDNLWQKWTVSRRGYRQRKQGPSVAVQQAEGDRAVGGGSCLGRGHGG